MSELIKRLRQYPYQPEIPESENSQIIGNKILNGWYGLKALPSFNIDKISAEISEIIAQVHKEGAFILPKSPAEIRAAIEENRLVAVLGRDQKGEICLVACSSYSILSENREIVEVGALVKNPNITIRKDHPDIGKSKELVFPINNHDKETLGTQVLMGVLAQIAINYKNSSPKIIATTRGLKSEKALSNAGFERVTWNNELRRVSCDPGCIGVGKEKFQNCPFADMEFQNNINSGCHLMLFDNQNR